VDGIVPVGTTGESPTLSYEEHILVIERAVECVAGKIKVIAGTGGNSTAETNELLSCEPERLGHATYLDEEAKEVVLARRTCIEMCLTSNLLCKTVQQLQDHPIRYYLARNHPIAICTDDILPFRNSILGEYALLMAPKPVGLGLTESEIETVARMGMESRFRKILP